MDSAHEVTGKQTEKKEKKKKKKQAQKVPTKLSALYPSPGPVTAH